MAATTARAPVVLIGASYDGASIYNLVYDASEPRAALTTLRDSIVADATAGIDVASNKTAYIHPANLGSAAVDAGQFDLVTSIAAREQGTITGSPLTADPLLGELRDNGGPTATMAPALGSPAIDAGAAFGLGADQRGAPRPSDFGAVANAGDGSDIGAFEAQVPAGAGAGTGPGGTGASSSGSRPAFGARTLVTLRVGAKRISARGRSPWSSPQVAGDREAVRVGPVRRRRRADRPRAAVDQGARRRHGDHGARAVEAAAPAT
ncbi:MAG TPA: choice-of-anchor Q domain-containing protein, partial [Solirubrobacteraceae bacterium]|nr:choice-of-anchor Q domain-containing protein [Solirubrobacteraceae bacterium]